MDVSSIASMATEMSNATVQQTKEVAVLKKAIDIEAQGALQLLSSIAPPAVSSTGGTAGLVVSTRV